jgi:quercetin dioxygenase-like cupin family protein
MNFKAAIIAACPALATPAAAQIRGEVITPNFEQAIPNIPGKSLVAVVVHYAPGGASHSHSHTHAKSAFVYAYVIAGVVESQVNDGPERVYHAGESFYELPGAHHAVSRNASATEPAKLLAVFVVDTDDKALTTPDK